MNNEFSHSFNKLDNLTISNLSTFYDTLRYHFESMVVNLHQLGVLDDLHLEHVVGWKCYNGNYQKIPGPVAKYFACNAPAYAYPLFKTHKITATALENISILDIPVRFLKSAGYICTSRITAFTETLLQPGSDAKHPQTSTAETAEVIY